MIRLRTTQQGYAEGLVPLMTLIVFAFLGLLSLAFLASFVIPFTWLKGRARIAILLGVVGLWGYLYWINIGQVEGFKKWRLTVWAISEQEQARLPASFSVEGILDEGAALRSSSIVRLFAERRLAFIEIKIRKDGKGRSFIAFPDGDGPLWIIPQPAGQIARLTLGKQGDPACVELPIGLDGRMNRPPFLPDTCIRIHYADAATARHALALRPASPDDKITGSWTLLDRTTGTPLALLTTVDTRSSVTSSTINALAKPSLIDDRSPYTVLADRLIGPPFQAGLASQILQDRQVKAKIDIASAASSVDRIPTVIALEETVSYTDSELDQYFRHHWKYEVWASAVARAQADGVASFGERILNWRERTLSSLGPPANKLDSAWKSFAVDDGFIVMKSRFSGDPPADKLFARYANDGSLKWLVRIEVPSNREPACHGFLPQAVYTAKQHLVLAKLCLTQQEQLDGKRPRGIIWTVPLSQLPGKL